MSARPPARPNVLSAGCWALARVKQSPLRGAAHAVRRGDATNTGERHVGLLSVPRNEDGRCNR
jgi:hypothetical protein